MPAPAYIHHEASLQHDTGHHPEQMARITAIESELETRDWLGFRKVQAPAAERAQIEQVHSPEHIEAIEHLSARGGGMVDADTVTSAGSFEAAVHAAGGAVLLVDELLGGAAPTGFNVQRPPGHHALSDRAMGFCLFNNVAIAARHAQVEHGVERVLVLDWDVHHGNGTNDIFHRDPSVLFVSIHEWPLYPGSGPASDSGSGAGEGYTVNLPVPAGSGDSTFASLVEHVVVRLARAYEPGLLLVSAGYDAHADDPLAGCSVSEQGYAAMTGSMRRAGAALGVPAGFLLEGGYDLGALARSVAATMAVMAEPDPPAAPELDVDPLAAAALERLAARWPALSAGASSG